MIVASRTTTPDGVAAGDRFDAVAVPGEPGTYAFPANRLALSAVWDLGIVVRRAGLPDATAATSVDLSETGLSPPRLVADAWRWPRMTLPAWGLGALAFAALLGGVLLVARLRGLEPFAAAIVLTMTALITGGFAVQAARMTVPETAGTALANPVPADPGSLGRGEALYRAACLACHGPAGAGVEDGDPAHGHGSRADLTDRRTRSQRDGDLFHTIGAGVPGSEMPAYDAALSEAERWDLVNYLRELQRRRPVATPEA